MDLRQLLLWLTTPAAGVVAYWLIDNVTFFQFLSSVAKRNAAYILTAIIAVGAYLLQVAFQYTAVPLDWRAWVEAIVSVALVAFGVSQLIHEVRDLRQ